MNTHSYFLIKNGPPAGSFELREDLIPEPKEGEVRIEVSAFGLNYADVLARQGLYRECPPLPCVIGYDVEGIIDAVGDQNSLYKVGDRVFALTRFGGYARYAITKEVALNLLPENAPVGVGCALATQCVTAYHAAIHCQTLMPGEVVLIHAAAGGLGTALMQIAKSKGCEIIGIVGGKAKAAYITSQGADHVVDHHTTSFEEYVTEHFPKKVDVIFDTVGGSDFKKGKSILAKGGRIVSLGAASLSGKRGFINLVRLGLGFGFFSPISYLQKSQSLIGINMLKIADNRPDIIAEEFKQVASLYDAGILQPHVGKIFNHTELADAHEWMENRQSIGKGVVVW